MNARFTEHLLRIDPDADVATVTEWPLESPLQAVARILAAGCVAWRSRAWVEAWAEGTAGEAWPSGLLEDRRVFAAAGWVLLKAAEDIARTARHSRQGWRVGAIDWDELVNQAVAEVPAQVRRRTAEDVRSLLAERCFLGVRDQGEPGREVRPSRRREQLVTEAQACSLLAELLKELAGPNQGPAPASWRADVDGPSERRRDGDARRC